VATFFPDFRTSTRPSIALIFPTGAAKARLHARKVMMRNDQKTLLNEM
jgi:hypothetical protein